MSKEKFQRFWEKFGTLCILLLMFVAFAIATPIVKDGKQYFLTQNNMIQVLLQSIVYMLLAFGEFFAILLAGIDLSVGSVACFTGVVIAKLALAGVPSVICVFVGLLGAMAMGTINGLLINALYLHPFVVRNRCGLNDLDIAAHVLTLLIISQPSSCIVCQYKNYNKAY